MSRIFKVLNLSLQTGTRQIRPWDSLRTISSTSSNTTSGTSNTSNSSPRTSSSNSNSSSHTSSSNSSSHTSNPSSRTSGSSTSSTSNQSSTMNSGYDYNTRGSDFSSSRGSNSTSGSGYNTSSSGYNTSGNQRDIISLILEDHSKIKRTFDAYERTSDLKQRESAVRQAIRELSLHASKEEMVLYENLRNNNLLNNGKEIAEHNWHEHEETKKLLFLLDMKLKPTDGEYDTTMRQIIQMMRKHIKEEEEQLLPEIKRNCDEKKLFELGHSYIQHENIAVTRPHPAAPDKGILGKMANAATKPLDQLRDAMNPPPSSKL